MTITITPSGGGSATTLCHGATRALGQATGPANLHGSVEPGIRQRQYVGDTGPRHEATGMDIITITFTTTTIYATAILANTAAITTLTTTPRTGTIAYGSTTIYTAAITSIRLHQQGRSITTTYTINGALTQET